jgi:hypothetical protein
MSDSIETTYSPQVEYTKKVLLIPSYRISKLIPLTGQGLTLGISSTTNTQFELQTNVMNLSRSCLTFDITLPFQGAGAYQWCQADPLALFDRIQLYTRGGVSLIDLQGANNFSSLVTPYKTKLTDLIQRTIGGTVVNGAVSTTINSVMATDSNQVPIQGIQASNGIFTTNFRPDGTNGIDNYAEQKHLFQSPAGVAQVIFNPVGPVAAVAQVGFICLSYQLNLSNIIHSIAELDQDLYFGENLILSLTYAPCQKFTWTTQVLNQPHTVPIAPVNASTITNLSLYLSIETNLEIANGLIAKTHSPEGFSINVPFVYSQKYASTAGSSSSIFQRFNRGHGSRILRFYYGLFNTLETCNSTLDHSNVGCSKITNYYSTINNMRCQEFPVDCTMSLDWLVNSGDIDHSSILSINQFKYQFCHMENYSGQRPCECNDTIITGLDLGQEKTFGVYVNTVASAFNHWLFTVIQRDLRIGGGQIMFV